VVLTLKCNTYPYLINQRVISGIYRLVVADEYEFMSKVMQEPLCKLNTKCGVRFIQQTKIPKRSMDERPVLVTFTTTD
jgi:hypothetical protein